MSAKVDVPFERELLDGLGRILLTDADSNRARATLVSLTDRLGEAAPVAFKHKVTTVMSENAHRFSSDTDPVTATAATTLANHLATDEADARNHRTLLLGEVKRISANLADRGCIIKGFCNARFYPDGYTRWMRDIDVFCPSWEDALALLDSLLDDGYDYDRQECSWVKADLPYGRDLYGQIFLIRPEGDDFCRVDIHYGTYSVGYAGYLDLDPHRLADTYDLDGQDVNVLRPELCPLIAQSHALSDGYVAIKDINDFVALATSDARPAWAQIGRDLRRHQLHPQATLLASHVLDLYDHPDVQAAATALLNGLGRHAPKSLWQTHNRSWLLRAIVNTSFAFRWKWHRTHRPDLAVTDAVRCLLFYGRRLSLVVRDRTPWERVLHALMAEPDLTNWDLRPDACTLLIEPAVIADLTGTQPNLDRLGEHTQTVGDGIDVSTIDGFEVVEMKGRRFIPTLDLVIEPALAQAVTK